MSEDTWWNHQGATVAKPTVLLVAPRRGDFGGPCAHASCSSIAVDWYNRATCSYYCKECAQGINEKCRISGMRKVCDWHG